MADTRGRDRGARDQVITAPELRDDTGPVVEERPVAPPPRREPPPRRRGSSGAGLLATLLALAAAVLIGLILWSLFADDDEADRAGNAGVSIDDITDDPARYLGRTVTVGGEVNQILSPRAFVLEGDDLVGGDDLLVVGANELGGISPDEVVLVSGPVRRFNLAEAERDLGVDLDDNLFRDFDGRPAIVARDITLRPVPAAGAPGAGPVLGVGPLLETPDRYVGQPVTVNGRVTRVVEPNAVVLDNRLLVTARNLPNNLQVGTPLRVTGPFNRFALPTFERDLGVDLNDQLFAEFNNQPAIAATNVVATP